MKLAAVLLLSVFPGGIAAVEAPRILILTGHSDLPAHDWRTTTPFLRGLLSGAGFDVKVEEEVRGITAETLAGYDALILHYNGPRWGQGVEQAIERFLRSGKGMVAIHGISYGPFYGQQLSQGTRRLAGEPWAAYADMMGMTWALENIGHSRRHVFAVRWIEPDHPICKGLPEVFQTDDELYHKIDLRPNAKVLASAYSDPAARGTGKAEPMIWTVDFGDGRIVHITLGHDLLAMSQPGFIQALQRAAEWAAAGAAMTE